MIVTVTAHKTVDEIVVITAGPELADTMGRFEFARWQPQHKAYWVETKHLPKLTEQLGRLGHTVVDNRRDNAEALYSGPFPECASCGSPASRRADRVLKRCTNCGAPWRSIIFDGPTSGPSLVACTVCGHKQRPGANYCGQCGDAAPPPESGAPRPAIAHVERQPLQDPLPVGACIPDHLAVDDTEEPDREWYP